MKNLPNEIIENILLRLPAEAALQAKRVCTAWKTLLRNHKSHKPGYLFCHGHGGKRKLFYEDEYDHYDHARINYYHSHDTLTEVEHTSRSITRFMDAIVGSCNGLVCLGETNEDVLGVDPFLLCNPLTGECIFLPRYNYAGLPQCTNFRPHEVYSRLASGFGHCPSTNEYKVVTIYHYPGEQKGHVQVYTIGGEWRYIGCIERRYNLYDVPGIYANGTLYWLHTNDHNKVQECKIVAFDLQCETFRSIRLPSSKYNSSISPLKLLGRNNNLYLTHTNCTTSSIDIWVYMENNRSTGTRQNYHGESSWVQEFSIPLVMLHYFTPFTITRNNEVLLWYRWRGAKIFCYDPKTSTLNSLWDTKANGAKCVNIEAISHTQSIVSLKDLGETNVTYLRDLDQATESKSGSEQFLKKSAKRKVAKRRKIC